VKDIAVCIGCGRRDTSHPSKLCGKCMMHTANENEVDEHDMGRRIPLGDPQRDNGQYRCLPGPREDE
jgi:hypothetical protein